MSLVQITDAQKFYGTYHALRGINLEIGAGEFFSLLGPSGCGKTTLLRAIAGFEDLSSGAVMIGGKNMSGLPANERPTNMVFQSYAIFPHLNVAENVGFGLRKLPVSKSEKAAKVDAALAMVGLEGFGLRRASQLSGGQRQRVALARALVLEPQVLLLDEPLSALDKKLREHMQSELRRLQRQVGITFVLVTHDQEEALIMSDRIAVMFDGQIAQVADPQTLYTKPATKQVAEFIGMMRFLEGHRTSSGINVAGLGVIPSEGGQDGKVTVGVRPECFTIKAPGEAGERGVKGVVLERAYYGDLTNYEVALGGAETPICVSVRNTPGRAVLEVGQEVHVAWSPESVVVFENA